MPEEKKSFIHAKVVKQKLTKKELAKKGIWFGCKAASFGVIAAVGFIATCSVAKPWLIEETAEESAIYIPKDEPDEPAEANPTASGTENSQNGGGASGTENSQNGGDASGTENSQNGGGASGTENLQNGGGASGTEISQNGGDASRTETVQNGGGASGTENSQNGGDASGTTGTPQDHIDASEKKADDTMSRREEREWITETVKEQVQSAMTSYRYTVDDLNAVLDSLRAQVQDAGKGIVTVCSVQQQTDWLDNPVEMNGLYAGAIIAETEDEFLILTPDEAIAQADSIEVTFHDGRTVNGSVKQRDMVSEMAVVSVRRTEVDLDTRRNLTVLPLGNSYMVREGDCVVAVGSPMGVVRSVDYGFVSYISKNVPMIDQASRILYTDVNADVEKGTFFLNTSGELIGWAIQQNEKIEDESELNRITKVMCISGYKPTLERMSNGQNTPYVGIIGQETAAGNGAGSTASGGSDGGTDGGLELPEGLYVTSVIVNGPAYEAGIQCGDVITRVGDENIYSMKGFQSAIEKLDCGQTIKMTVQRNGRDQYTELEFSLIVGERGGF